jgi:DegV family protein with EDD domain
MIRVITDSTSDLPEAICRQLGISVVPLSVRFGDEMLADGVDLDSAGFWSRLAGTTSMPETAAPSAGSFMDAFTSAADEGADGIVAVTLSSRLSGTYQSAAIAAENVSASVPVRVVDSGTVSMALGIVAMAAAEAAAAGADLGAVAAVTAETATRVEVLVALDTLEFLQRGGRIGKAQALIGGMLDIKPLITVEDGVVTAAGRVRTRSKARLAILERARQHDRAPRMSVIHGAADDVDEVTAAVRGVVGDRVMVAELGPVVATHAGPGTIGIAYQRV